MSIARLLKRIFSFSRCLHVVHGCIFLVYLVYENTLVFLLVHDTRRTVEVDNDNVDRLDKLKILLEKRLKNLLMIDLLRVVLAKFSTFRWILCKLSYDEILARDKNVVFEKVFFFCCLMKVVFSW